MAFFGLVAFFLGAYLASVVFGWAGGGLIGFLLGAATFVGTGWIIFIAVPLIGGGFSAKSSKFEKALRESGLLPIEERYNGDISVVYVQRFNDSARSMGRFGTGEGTMYLGSSSYGKVTGTDRIDVPRTMVHPYPSREQERSWDIYVYRAVDHLAYDAAANAGDQRGMLEAAEQIALFVVQPNKIQEFHRLMRAALPAVNDESHGAISASSEVSLSSAIATNDELIMKGDHPYRTHYGEHHKWDSPTRWGGMMDWNAYWCTICGMITQQAMHDGEFDSVPFRILKASPAGMDIDTQVPELVSVTIANTHEGDWEWQDNVDHLDVEGQITGTLKVPTGKSAYIPGAVGRLVIDGGEARVWNGGEVLGDVVFNSGHVFIWEVTVLGALVTDAVESFAEFADYSLSLDREYNALNWQPNGFGTDPRIFVSYNADVRGGIQRLTQPPSAASGDQLGLDL